MAEPLSRFDRSSIKSVSGKQSAAALAAPEGSVHLYQKEGLTVAIWGSPVFREKHYNQLALSEGIAKTLADQWRNRRTDIFSGLEGAFSICILDEDAAEAVLATDRMGIYPVSFQLSGQALVFGSTADSIIIHPLIKPEIA